MYANNHKHKTKVYLKEYRKKNKRRLAQQQNQYWAEHPEQLKVKVRKAHYRTKYGITIEQFDAMMSLQGGVCAICLKPPKETRRLCVDHEHIRKAHPEDSGRVRGLLCHYCNLRRVGKARKEHGPMFLRIAAYIGSDFDGRTLPTGD